MTPESPAERAGIPFAWLNRLLRATLTALVAVILLFEEWGWEPLSAAVARLARLSFFARMEDRIRRLPPWAAIGTFALPIVALFPI